MAPRSFSWMVLAAALAGVAGGCTAQFTEASVIDKLRVLAISAEPADLAPGELTQLSALVATVSDEPVEYQWEWCPVDRGPNYAYECIGEELGLSPDVLALLDLGQEPTALMIYPGDGETLQELCYEAVANIAFLPDFAEVPNCDVGVDVRIRLTVRQGDQELVAVKNLFLWFEEPEEGERNENPQILEVHAGGATLAEDETIYAAPSNPVRWQVVIDPEAQQTFTPINEDDPEPRKEELLVSYFASGGAWEDERTFTLEGRFSLQGAGVNTLAFPATWEEERPIDVYLVVRDGRGGMSWATRHALLADPAGGQAP